MSGHPFSEGEQICPPPWGSAKWCFWGKGGFSTHSGEKQRYIFVSGAKRWPPLVGPSSWTNTFTSAPQKSGGWLGALPLPLPSAGREVQQHRSPSNNLSSLLAALPLSVLAIRNPSFSLKLWCKSTALHKPTRVMSCAGCMQTPLHLCLFCEFARNSW